MPSLVSSASQEREVRVKPAKASKPKPKPEPKPEPKVEHVFPSRLGAHVSPRELWGSDRKTLWQRDDGVWINQARVDRAIGWIEANCFHRDSAGGTGKPIPLVLAGWQRRDLTEMIGPCDPETGRRTLRNVVLPLPRRNGKSTFASTIAMLFAFGPESVPASELGFTASTQDQADRTVFSIFKRMVADHPEFGGLPSSDIKVYKSVLFNNLIDGGITARSLVGDNPSAVFGVGYHLVIMDEVGWLRNTDLFDAMASSRGDIWEPLLIVISSKTYKAGNPLPDIIRMARENRSGDWHYVPYELDENDDPADESVWHKANPNIGIAPSWEDMRAECAARRGNPTLWRNFLATRLNIDVGPEDCLIDIPTWSELASTDLDISDFKGRECVIALDVSAKTDLTSSAVYFKKTDTELGALFVYSWAPIESLSALGASNVQDYEAFVATGELRTTSGAVVDYAEVLKDIDQITADCVVTDVLFDGYRSELLSDEIRKAGVRFGLTTEVAMTPDGMGQFTDTFERMITARGFRYLKNEPLDIAARGIVAVSETGDRRLPGQPDDARIKVDPIIASIMAVGIAEGPSRGFDYRLLSDFTEPKRNRDMFDYDPSDLSGLQWG